MKNPMATEPTGTSLQRLTEQDLGYRYYDSQERREEAIARWKEWLAGK